MRSCAGPCPRELPEGLWQVQGSHRGAPAAAALGLTAIIHSQKRGRHGAACWHLCVGTSSLSKFSAPLWGLLRPPSMANNVTLSDRFNINSQLEHLQASACA